MDLYNFFAKTHAYACQIGQRESNGTAYRKSLWHCVDSLFHFWVLIQDRQIEKVTKTWQQGWKLDFHNAGLKNIKCFGISWQVVCTSTPSSWIWQALIFSSDLQSPISDIYFSVISSFTLLCLYSHPLSSPFSSSSSKSIFLISSRIDFGISKCLCISAILSC